MNMRNYYVSVVVSTRRPFQGIDSNSLFSSRISKLLILNFCKMFVVKNLLVVITILAWIQWPHSCEPHAKQCFQFYFLKIELFTVRNKIRKSHSSLCLSD